MKIIFRISIILLLGILIAGGYSFVLNQTNLISTNSPQQSAQTIAHFVSINDTQTEKVPAAKPAGGDTHGVSLSRGFSELFATLLKLSVIAAVLVILQVGLQGIVRKRSRRTLQDHL